MTDDNESIPKPPPTPSSPPKDPYGYKGTAFTDTAKAEVNQYRAALRKAIHKSDGLAGEVRTLREDLYRTEGELEVQKFTTAYVISLTLGFAFAGGLLLGMCMRSSP